MNQVIKNCMEEMFIDFQIIIRNFFKNYYIIETFKFSIKFQIIKNKIKNYNYYINLNLAN
jgi:hypothetical protein